MAETLIPFGRNFNDTPQPATCNGLSGFWTLPRQWYTKPNPNGTNRLIASPNADFSNPVYDCAVGDDGITFVFQDLLQTKFAGLDQ